MCGKAKLLYDLFVYHQAMHGAFAPIHRSYPACCVAVVELCVHACVSDLKDAVSQDHRDLV